MVRRHRLGTFDPTPSATPARSLIAAIDPPKASGADDPARSTSGGGAPATRNPAGARRELDQPTSSGTAGAIDDGGPSPWLLGAGAVVLLLAPAALALWWRRRGREGPPLGPADRAIADLVIAMRRAGRPVPPGVTLIELERRRGRSRDGAGYLAALRAARYGPATNGPTLEQRRAFRRELVAGLGWRGRVRAWWALPPQRR